MDEIGKMLVSPVFWVGTVLVGLIVNFASQWLYGPLASLPGKWGEWRRKRSDALRTRHEKDVAALLAMPSLIPLHVAREMRHRSHAQAWLTIAATITVMLLLAENASPPIGELGSWQRYAMQISMMLLVLFCLAFWAIEIGKALERMVVLSKVARTIRAASHKDSSAAKVKSFQTGSPSSSNSN